MSVTVSQPRIITPQQDPNLWDAYVSKHPKAAVFHSSQIVQAYDETPNCESFAIAAVNESGNIIALLTAVRVSVLSGLMSNLSSRSIMYAEPLADPTPEAAAALSELVAAHDQAMKSTTLLAEVRAIAAPGQEQAALLGNGYEFEDYLNYVVDTSKGGDALWGNLNKSLRNKIRRSHRRGVEIKQHTTHEAIDRMYALVTESYRRSRVPLVDVQLFHAALDHFPQDVVQMRIATYQGEDVAAGIGLMFRGRFYAWYGGSLRIQGIDPFACVTWDEIRWTSEQGGRFYDFGGAGRPDEEYGPREFKARFHGDLVCYGRYQQIYAPAKLALAEKAYQSLRAIVSGGRDFLPFVGGTTK